MKSWRTACLLSFLSLGGSSWAWAQVELGALPASEPSATKPSVMVPRLPMGIAGDPVIAAAGDIACDPSDGNYNGGNGTATACAMKATSDTLLAVAPAAVLLLGDNQYEDGTLAKYFASYDPTWGRLKAITRPAPGNHEYNTAGAAGYYSYFGAAAGDPAKGYYSYDLGSWHLIALNSNCAVVPCVAGSAQELWLASDLAAHPGVCTLAYWHHPRFSSGPHGDDSSTAAFWVDLHAAGADVVLDGHDHIYERFAPQTALGTLDAVRGIREFVVGTGGRSQTSVATIRANSEVRNVGAFGVLKLTLHPAGYDWQFVAAAGSAFTDSGSASCHRAPAPLAYYTMTPCRIADTRGPAGLSGAPALAANSSRTFPISSLCGVPDTARSVALNVTVVSPTDSGELRVGPASIADVATSTVSFAAGTVRAAQTTVGLGENGRIGVRCDMPGSTGTTQMIIDVAGFFQ
ncbi:MAG: metallophosphoesterase [Thermoanaerobaculia bacterium]